MKFFLLALLMLLPGCCNSRGEMIVESVFPQNVSEIEKLTASTIAQAQKSLDEFLKQDDASATFKSIMQNFDRIEQKFSIAQHAISVLQMVSPEQSIRDASQASIMKLRAFAVDSFTTRPIYQKFKTYVQNNANNENLSLDQQYWLDEIMKSFVRAGLALSDADYEKVKSIKKELSNLSLKFESNIATDNRTIELSSEELAGVSDEFISQLKKLPNGKYAVGCDYPTYHEIMDYCTHEPTRKALYIAFNNRAYPANEKVLSDVIASRDELARLLGYKNYSHFDITDEMATSTERVEDFISTLSTKSQEKTDKEFANLKKEFPEFITPDGLFDPWNLPFVKATYKKKHFNLDERVVAQYFPMERTINALFKIYQSFLSLRFELKDLVSSWSNDLKLIEVYDKKNNALLGYIILDLFPRENKYSHACHAGIVPALEGEGPSVGVVIANFPKPAPNKPSLLKHNDVVTFFHEFGHAMHSVLGRTALYNFAGTATKTDFVEMPSQMFEEWMWNKDILKQVSHHYKTGNPLPDDVIETMISLYKFDSGYFVSRQLSFALFSLYLFRDKIDDLNGLWKNVQGKCVPQLQHCSDSHFPCSFGHLMGYSSKYYSYMWSKVFALDIFGEIKKHGLLDEKIGMKFREEVLAKGGSIDPNNLLKTFLGREPNQEAFLQNLGLV